MAIPPSEVIESKSKYHDNNNKNNNSNKDIGFSVLQIRLYMKAIRSLTFFPCVLLQSEPTEDTVMALVTAAVKTAIRQTPVSIHSPLKRRP